jgi:cellobiose phosphorylase
MAMTKKQVKAKDSGYRKYGDFDASGREFIITRQDTPKLWGNHSWNRLIDVLVDQRGRGMSMYRSPEGDRTYLIKDRTVYLKDRGNGRLWTLGWDPIRLKFDYYRACHGLGYTRLEMNKDGLESTWTVLAAAEGPVELWRVRVRNASHRTRQISVYPCVEFDLRGFDVYCNMENSILCEVAEDRRTIYAINKANERPNAKNSCFMATAGKPVAFQTSKKRFLGGTYGSLDSPAEIQARRLSSFATYNEDLVGVFQFDASLRPGREIEFNIVIGPFQLRKDADELRDAWLSPDIVDRELARQAQRTECYGRADFAVPDKYFTNLVNIWAKQQLMFMGDFSRGWSMGFRDTCQDAQAICPYKPQTTRALIVETVSHQHPDGSALRSWFPIDTHKYADSGVWLTFTLADYIKETGDLAILDEVVPYYDGGEDTVYQHVLKALKWIYADPGPRGLTKVFFGDWNDALDIGRGGRGESVWLAIALVWAHSQIIELAERIGDSQTAAFFRAEQQKLKENIEKHCWDGEWYMRGFTDVDEKVGSRECEEGKIYGNPQTWAIMAGIAPDRADLLERSLRKYLVHDYGLLVMWPAYSYYRPSHGRITTRPMGWGVNGSSYCHVSGFKAFADAVRRDGNGALDTLSRILPNNPRNPIGVSAAEPYGFTNMYNGPQHARPGVSLRQWYTGTVAWTLRAVAERMLGVRPDYDGLMIDPVLPDAWPRVHMTRSFRQALYDIDIRRAARGAEKRLLVTVDGQPLEGNLIPYPRFSGKHKVEVIVP